MTPNDLYEVVTLVDVGTVVELLRRVIAAIETLGLDVLAVIDYSGDAFDVGLGMQETKLVLFAGALLVSKLVLAHPDIGLELPLGLLIRDEPDGRVSLSYHDPGSLARRHRLSDDEARELRIIERIAQATRRIP